MSLTYDAVVEKAEALASADIQVEALRMGNTAGRTVKETIAAHAQLRIAKDKVEALRDEYRKAFLDWRSAGFPD